MVCPRRRVRCGGRQGVSACALQHHATQQTRSRANRNCHSPATSFRLRRDARRGMRRLPVGPVVRAHRECAHAARRDARDRDGDAVGVGARHVERLHAAYAVGHCCVCMCVLGGCLGGGGGVAAAATDGARAPRCFTRVQPDLQNRCCAFIVPNRYVVSASSPCVSRNARAGTMKWTLRFIAQMLPVCRVCFRVRACV